MKDAAGGSGTQGRHHSSTPSPPSSPPTPPPSICGAEEDGCVFVDDACGRGNTRALVQTCLS